jgi:deoxyribodipyrimidine photolyase-related protein
MQTTKNKMKTTQGPILRLLLGDQLNINHSWFKNVDSAVTYVLMEIRSETDYARHHIQKVVGIFAAMRAFAAQLESLNHKVIYLHLNDTHNLQQFDKNLEQLIHLHQIKHFEYQLPDEYRVDEQLKQFVTQLSISYKAYDSEHFYTTREELGVFFKGKKTFLLESFYRNMRKKHHVLMMNDVEPLNGQWNFDQENREKLPKNHKAIAPLLFSNKVANIVQDIEKAAVITIGTIDANDFIWPVTRHQALDLLAFFNEHCLHLFGTFQDAMAPGEWSLYHSRLSFAMNIKLISPKEVIDSAIAAYEKNKAQIAFNQLEGFVRQIIGWREYMRGIYWLKMPDYAELNFFDHHEKLPAWYWTGNTKMNCLKHAIQQSLQYAYAHHIQRLMITGNFALLAGVHPDEVDAWYLGIYIDAFEWVEITNTRGMSQFADGGIVGSKPYVSAAAYINKMSSYCGSCYYNKAVKVGDKACPFNSLYWNFYDRHVSKLAKNPRIGMMYNVWRRMNAHDKAEILTQAEKYLTHINEL